MPDEKYPESGGSWLRDPQTGELRRNDPADVCTDSPAQPAGEGAAVEIEPQE